MFKTLRSARGANIKSLEPLGASAMPCHAAAKTKGPKRNECVCTSKGANSMGLYQLSRLALFIFTRLLQFYLTQTDKLLSSSNSSPFHLFTHFVSIQITIT